MILVDTNVLIALVDDEDALNAPARNDLQRLRGKPLFIATPVLAEACYTLSQGYQRARLRATMENMPVEAVAIEDETAIWAEVFDWLAKYEEHRPDWVDGYLAVLCGRERRFRVWTYDREFSTIWRRPDGSKIPLAVRRSK